MKADNLNPNRFVLDGKATADLRNKIKQDPQAGLKEAAQQFEGMLLQMVLKSMRDATPQDGMMNSDQTRFFTSIFDQQLAQNLSTQGKLGFAKLIEQQLGRNLASGKLDVNASSLEVLQQSLVERQTASSAGQYAGGGAERVLGQLGSHLVRSYVQIDGRRVEVSVPQQLRYGVQPHAVAE